MDEIVDRMKDLSGDMLSSGSADGMDQGGFWEPGIGWIEFESRLESDRFDELEGGERTVEEGGDEQFRDPTGWEMG